ncbi:MAG: hypothetical protein DMD87_23295 [Candidatus Rokuibacteriota bacterium]|nr:MAG: hypothetical protein DMD87_23295 [Candidatus Rokubacteria bacterium]
MTNAHIEISIKGQWVTVPAVEIGGRSIVVTGRRLRVATVHDEDWLEDELDDPESCIRRLKACRSNGAKADVFTFAQKLPAETPKYSYRMEWNSIAAIRLTTFADWWEKLPKDTRKNTRRAAKRGVVVKFRELDDALIGGLVALNNDSPMRQGVPFAHFGKTVEEVRKDYSSFRDRSDFICAYLGDELIGLMKLVYCGKVAAIMQLLTKSRHYDKRPANVLITTAVERCAQRGISYVTYGRYRYGNKDNSSLIDFKDRNGFVEVLVPKYHVPLTLRGAVCLKLGLHRGLVGTLPSSVIRVGAALRAKWYSWRLRAGVAQW